MVEDLKTITKKRLTQINDDLWSLIVRTRDNFICQKCLQNEATISNRISREFKEVKPSKYNDAHHIIGKDNKIVRWDISNGVCLCFYHHKNWLNKIGEEDKTKFYESITDYDELKIRARQVVKFNLDFCKEEFVRLYDIAMGENLRPDKIVPRYIVKELYEKEVKI